MRELNIPAATHGRLLIDDAESGRLLLVVGFHGYAQSADDMMTSLRAIRADASITRMAVQALNRFYLGRSESTVASWMTRQHRHQAISDNVAYVDAAVGEAAAGRPIERLVTCGFSQGVAMAFRAGVLGARKSDGILALGGDVPPELLEDATLSFPPVLLGRGTRDTWYSAEKMRADEARLLERGARVETLTFEGAHEWHPDFANRAARFLDSL